MTVETSLDQSTENRTASRGGSWITDFMINAILMLLAIAALYPFYNVLIISFGTPNGLFLPTTFNLSSYRAIFEHGGILRAFAVSIAVTVAGTILSMFVTTCAAYALSKKYPGRNLIMGMVLFTMFFGGGLIPYYLLVKNVGLINNYWVLIIPSLMNAFYMVIMLSFFREYPVSLEESAKIDGAGDFSIMMRIVVPTSMPVIAALSLFYAVDRWNDWWTPMLFITDVEKYPLQLLTRNLLINFEQIMQQTGGAAGAAGVILDKIGVLPDNLKMAVLIFNIVPIMLVYPFLQKYFAKGVMIGSVKG